MNFDKPVSGQLLKRKALNVDSCVPRKKRKRLYPLQGWTVEKDWNVEEAKLSNNNNYIIEKKNEDNKENAKPKNKELKEKYKASTKTTTTTTTEGPLIIKTPKVVRKKIPVKANTIVESSNAKDTENEVAPIRSADNQELNPPTSAPEKTINDPETPVKQLTQRQSQRSSVQKINSVKHPVIIDETIDVNHNDMTITETHPVVKNVPINSTMPFHLEMRELKIVLHRVDEKQSTIQNQMKKNKEHTEKTNFDIKTSTKYTPAANTKSFLDYLDEELIGTKIPIDVKKILIKHQYDNPMSFIYLNTEIFEEIENDENDGKETKFKFVGGVKRLLESLVQIVKDKGQEHWQKLITKESEMVDLNDGANDSSTNHSLIVDLIKTREFVDKTKFIEPLLTCHQRRRIMVVRPRRFGKTYFLLTIAEICKGIKSKYLFKNYAIGKGEYDWQNYPVIFLNLSDLSIKSIEKCKNSFRLHLDNIAENYGLKLKGDDVKSIFKWLIHDLNKKTKRPVVILIDEYDTPVVRTQNKNEKLQKGIRQIVKDILEACKSQSNFIKLTFITGITTCCLSDMYSGPNDISKCTYEEQFATAFGFTEREIRETFKTELTDMKNELNKKNNNNQQITDDGMIEMLKKKYNGYYFSVHGKSVYNPWSIRQCFDCKRLSNYWYNSNHMTTHFVENIMDNPDQYKIIDKLPLSCTQEELDMDKMQEDYFKQVLLQAGYLTINHNKNNNKITLNWPNEEVQFAFEQTLMKVFLKKEMELITNTTEILNDLEQSNIDSILAAFNSTLSSYFPSYRTEKFHHELMLHILKKIGLSPKSEYQLKNNKILDTAFNVKNIGYVFEYGLNNAYESHSNNANLKLKQIKEREYFKVFEEENINVDKIFIVAIILLNEQAAYYKQEKVIEVIKNGKVVKYKYEKHSENKIK